jgi:integrase
MPAPDPQPISREDFHKLLTAGNGSWRAFLLVSLNCAFHIGEAVSLRWNEIDLEKGTYATLRGKTGIPRAAVLWPETVEALKALPRTGSEYVFVSKQGTKFNRAGRTGSFARLRDSVGLTLSFESIRDGSYTTACQAKGVDERQAKVLAGHACGMSDKYVLRNPGYVADACQAVYKAYMG